MRYNILANTRSIYIHWPFCPYKCHFCPFVAVSGVDHFMERYHKALVKEIEEFASQQRAKAKIDTLFFGGGTPSTYPDHLLLDMSGRLKNVFDFNRATEVTIEINPGTVRPEQLPLWKEIGINRLSIGVQGIKDSVLENLNRKQSAEDVIWLLEQAKEYFHNISIDLILGLPGVSKEEWQEMLMKVVTWPINHISVYFLTVHEDTPLYTRVKNNQVILPEDETMVQQYYWTVEYLAAHGIKQYEISNFARDGFESKHNSVYWERKPYKGFGVGACSFDGSYRFQNHKNLMKYMTALEQGTESTFFNELLSKEQIYLERVMLGLRKTKGILVNDLIDDLSSSQKEKVWHTINWLVQENLINYYDGRIVLTTTGLAVQNEVIVRLTL